MTRPPGTSAAAAAEGVALAHTAPRRGGRLWVGMLMAPAAWVVAGLAGYLLVSRSCEPGSNGLGLSGFREPATVLVYVAGVMLLLSIAGLLAAESSRRAGAAVHLEGESAHRHAGGMTRFLAVAGIFTSALMVGGIVLFGVPAFLLQACVQAH